MKALIVAIFTLIPFVSEVKNEPSVEKHKIKEGVVHYTHHRFLKANMSEEQKAQLASIPDVSTGKMAFSFKQNKAKYELLPDASSSQSFVMAGGQIYFDLETNNYVTLSSLSQKNYAVKREVKQPAEITPTGETKMIAGYECKKAIIKTEKAGEIEIFYTPEIGYNHSPDYYAGVEGFVLEFKSKTHHYIAEKVEKKSIGKDILTLPETHQMINGEQYDDLLQEFMSTSGRQVINLKGGN